MKRFDYTTVSIGDLRVSSSIDAKSGRHKVAAVLVRDEPVQPSQRFWNSIFSKYGFGNSFFKYYSHEEVFTRISETDKNDQMRLCIERDDESDRGVLLGVSNPSKPVVGYDELVDLLADNGVSDPQYSDGVVNSMHDPRVQNNFSVAGDNFKTQFCLSTPIDGYGSPNIYLAMLRLVCANGAVAMTKAFRSSLNLGKDEGDTIPAIIRALDGFNSDEGFAALRQRWESSTTSWASVCEANTLYKHIVKLHHNKHIDVNDKAKPKGTSIANLLTGGSLFSSSSANLSEEEEVIAHSPLLSAFHRMTGDVNRLYGLANIDAFSIKKQRALPVKCTVYDLLNFASELSTHYATPVGAGQLSAWIGGTLSEEYDMEGTKEKHSDFQDFMIDSKLVSGATG